MAIATSTALLLAGVAISAVGAIGSGIAAGEQADFEAADLAQRAVREREIAEQNEKDFRREQSRLMAQSRANQGGSGVITSTGSPLLAAEDFASETELQALRIRAGGLTESSRLAQQSQLTKSARKSARTRGFFRAGSSLLTGAGQAFS